jgi:hypothetical protein
VHRKSQTMSQEPDFLEFTVIRELLVRGNKVASARRPPCSLQEPSASSDRLIEGAELL